MENNLPESVLLRATENAANFQGELARADFNWVRGIPLVDLEFTHKAFEVLGVGSDGAPSYTSVLIATYETVTTMLSHGEPLTTFEVRFVSAISYRVFTDMGKYNLSLLFVPEKDVGP